MSFIDFRIIEYPSSDWAVIVDKNTNEMVYQGHITDTYERLLWLLNVEVEQRPDFRADRDKMKYADAKHAFSRNRFPEGATFPKET